MVLLLAALPFAVPPWHAANRFVRTVWMVL